MEYEQFWHKDNEGAISHPPHGCTAIGRSKRPKPDYIQYSCICGLVADWSPKSRLWAIVESPLEEFVDLAGLTGEPLGFDDGRWYVDPRDIRLSEDPDNPDGETPPPAVHRKPGV
jgi:hypothetical protein